MAGYSRSSEPAQPSRLDLLRVLEVVTVYLFDRVDTSGGNADVMVDHQQIVLAQQLAKGSYGTVYKGTYQGKGVAIKVEDFPSSSEGQANLLAELTALKGLSHERLVQHIGTGCMPSPAGPKVAQQQ